MTLVRVVFASAVFLLLGNVSCSKAVSSPGFRYVIGDLGSDTSPLSSRQLPTCSQLREGFRDCTESEADAFGCEPSDEALCCCQDSGSTSVSQVITVTATTTVFTPTSPLDSSQTITSTSTSTSSSAPTISVLPGIPPAQDGFKYEQIDPEHFSFTPFDQWKNDTDVPSCSKSQNTRSTSAVNATFFFNFTGSEAFLYTILSPLGGRFSISVNGGLEQVVNCFSNSTSCGAVPSTNGLNRRGIHIRTDAEQVDAINSVIGKVVDGTAIIDGATYQKRTSGCVHVKEVRLWLVFVVNFLVVSKLL